MPDLSALLVKLTHADERIGLEDARLKELWKQFSKTVREERLRRGMIFDQLEAVTGIGRGTLFYLENGERKWTLEKARLVVKALK